MRAVAVAAQKEPEKEIAAERLVLFGQRGLIGSRAEGNLVLAGKGVGGKPVPHPRKFETMQQEPDFRS